MLSGLVFNLFKLEKKLKGALMQRGTYYLTAYDPVPLRADSDYVENLRHSLQAGQAAVCVSQKTGPRFHHLWAFPSTELDCRMVPYKMNDLN